MTVASRGVGSNCTRPFSLPSQLPPKGKKQYEDKSWPTPHRKFAQLFPQALNVFALEKKGAERAPRTSTKENRSRVVAVAGTPPVPQLSSGRRHAFQVCMSQIERASLIPPTDLQALYIALSYNAVRVAVV